MNGYAPKCSNPSSTGMRIHFMYDRKLLSALSRCAWRVLSVYLRQSVLDDSAAPGAAIAVQTFGEFQNFNPHLHAIASDGCFSDNGVFQVAPGPKPRDLEDLFRYEVLKTEGKITDAVIENMVSWRRSGFRQPQFKYRVKTVVSRRHFAVGDHVEPDKSELRFRNEFYGFDVNVRVDTPMILGTLLFGFEFEFDGT